MSKHIRLHTVSIPEQPDKLADKLGLGRQRRGPEEGSVEVLMCS